MNLLIVGCGTVGSTLAALMCAEGHDVSVVDRSPQSFAALGHGFDGLTMAGNPIDLDFLKRAGIEGCDAVAAVTSSDNVNVMVSQLAREIFGIKQVITRIYDPVRKTVFAKFGLNIICPTTLAVECIADILLDRDSKRTLSLGGSTLLVETRPLPPHMEGRGFQELASQSGQLLVGLQRADGRLIVVGRGENPTLAQGDRLVVLEQEGGEPA